MKKILPIILIVLGVALFYISFNPPGACTPRTYLPLHLTTECKQFIDFATGEGDLGLSSVTSLVSTLALALGGGISFFAGIFYLFKKPKKAL